MLKNNKSYQTMESKDINKILEMKSMVFGRKGRKEKMKKTHRPLIPGSFQQIKT